MSQNQDQFYVVSHLQVGSNFAFRSWPEWLRQIFVITYLTPIGLKKWAQQVLKIKLQPTCVTGCIRSVQILDSMPRYLG